MEKKAIITHGETKQQQNYEVITNFKKDTAD